LSQIVFGIQSLKISQLGGFLLEAQEDMTRKEFGAAYVNGCNRTVRFLLSRGLSEDDARETAQAAWVRGWERRDQIRDSEKTLTWVNSIALNLYRSRRRRDYRQEELDEFPIPPRVSLIAIDVRRMMDRCSNTDRDLLEKRYFYGYGMKELARDQGCSQTAVRVRLMRARRSLRRMFEGPQACPAIYIAGMARSRRTAAWPRWDRRAPARLDITRSDSDPKVSLQQGVANDLASNSVQLRRAGARRPSTEPVSGPLGSINVGALAEECFCCLHDGL